MSFFLGAGMLWAGMQPLWEPFRPKSDLEKAQPHGWGLDRLQGKAGIMANPSDTKPGRAPPALTAAPESPLS